MGPPNVYSKCDEDLCCPVCKHPLSSPGAPPKPKLPKVGGTRGKLRPLPPQPQHNHPPQNNPKDFNVRAAKHAQQQQQKEQPTSAKDQAEDVVVAQCGHLFHKFCLRHYCYLFREGRSNHLTRATCPICRRSISMSSAQTILYREHQDHITDFDKEGTKTTLMNNELLDQMKNAKSKLELVQKSKEDAEQNLEIYRSHWKKLKKEMRSNKIKQVDVDSLKEEILRTDKILAIMQTQHLKIVRKYISKVKQKDPKDFIHFPRRLAPLLDMIEKDDRLVRDLGEVIMPIHLNHLKSDRQSLLKGIIDAVNEKIAEKRDKENAKAVVVQGKSLPKSKRPPIFVKVRKSSVSILSTTSLTRESIQKIIETVQAQAPIGILNNLQPKANISTNGVVDKVSASDIKIIYMPKRKMVEPVSEPCRSIEPSDSFFIKVPPRKCRSTDAVLMKQRRKRRKDIMAKGNTGNGANREIELDGKRSKSADAVKRQTAKEEMAVVPVEVLERRCSKKPSAMIAILSMPDVKGKEEHVKELRENFEKIRSASDSGRTEKDEPPEVKVKSPRDKDKVQQRISVLEMIYADLKTDPLPEVKVKERDENNNNASVLPVPANSKNSFGNRDDMSQSQPAPQFFRIDKKGNIRPESPYRMCFRQPTFLSSVTDILTDRSPSPFMSGCLEPDVENQLEALSPEDRYLLAAEQEAIASGIGPKKQLLFDLPACLGIPPGESPSSSCNPTGVSSNRSVPVYLKRWQEQLPSQKYFKMDSRPEVLRHVAHCRSARLDKKRSFMGQARPRPRIGLLQQQRERDRCNGGLPHKKPLQEKVHLPPLHMFPVKRPSTADCLRAGEPNRRMMEPSLPKLYNFSSMNTNNNNSFSEINANVNGRM